jgi:hypothetical protein
VTSTLGVEPVSTPSPHAGDTIETGTNSYRLAQSTKLVDA